MKRYYLGNYTRQNRGGINCFAPPVGVVGAIDLAPVSSQGSAANDRPVGLFVTTAAVLPSEYTLLAEGDCRDLAVDTRMQDAFRSHVGYRPQGDKLIDLIYDVLTDGSDPKGESAPKPLLPGVNGWCDLYLGGHSRVIGARFEWGKPCSRGRGHWQKVKQLLRDEFEKLFNDAKGGKLKDKEHHRRVLDFNCEKYGLNDEDWKELVPTKLQKDVPGRLKHETTITDNFTRANGSTIGNLLTWTEIDGDWETSSNAVIATSGGPANARADSDLSSADHYAQAVLTTAAVFNGAISRVASGATPDLYLGRWSGSTSYEIYKRVSGSYTLVTSPSGTGMSNNDVIKMESNGSTQTIYRNGASIGGGTDSSVTGNLRGGIDANASSTATFDDFEAADLGGGGGGITYVQLERTTRGVDRGTYTKW